MKITGVNLANQLKKIRQKEFDDLQWRNQVNEILNSHIPNKIRIKETLTSQNAGNTNDFYFESLDTSKIYHLDHIKKLCIDYRLRFLDTKYFKSKFPEEAINEIKRLEDEHQIELKGFKIIAPSKLFKLENADDPVLFAPMGNDYFYLIHKWGNDLHPLRKFFMWFFKGFENLVLLTFLMSVFLTLLVPDGLFGKEYSVSNFLMIFLFMFKSVAAIVIFYGFALGKNFNTAIWNSKYYNA